MCTGAAMEAAVDVVVYGMKAPADSGTGRVKPPTSPESRMPKFMGGVLSEQSRGLFERWLPMIKDPQQREFVEQLLALTDESGN